MVGALLLLLVMVRHGVVHIDLYIHGDILFPSCLAWVVIWTVPQIVLPKLGVGAKGGRGENKAKDTRGKTANYLFGGSIARCGSDQHRYVHGLAVPNGRPWRALVRAHMRLVCSR